jgi:uncharacterized protein
MFGRLMPREGRFFRLFNDHAEQIVQGAHALVALLDQLESPAEAAGLIDQHENAADRITHETIALLHKTFITPFDREDIHKLITGMDDILDLVRDVAQSLYLYDVRRVTPEAKQLADLCLTCCDQVRAGVKLLSDMGNAKAILGICQDIDRVESDADRVMRSAMSKLFRNEEDVRVVIKLRSIYEQLEGITDRCEDVANILEGIVLENS